MISFMKMAEAVSGSSETNEETGTQDQSEQASSRNEDTSEECQQNLISQQPVDTLDVSPENEFRESSVDPDRDVLIALAENEKLSSEQGVLEQEDEYNKPTLSQTEQLCKITDESDKLDGNYLDLNEKCDSTTSEIFFSDNLLNDSETEENQSVKDEGIPLNSTQEGVGIFITQDVTQEEGVIEDTIIATEVTREETSLTQTDGVPIDEPIATEIMPEKREDEVVSPSLQRANLRFRWAKTHSAVSNEVIFFSSHKREEPIKLTWSEAADCYYSQDMEVPTGVYKGTLVVDQKPYPIEEITIKHYTFEADLYIKEDVIEDNFNVGRLTTLEDVDTYGDKSGGDKTSFQYSGKIEDVIRQQMYSADTDQELTTKSDHGSGRHTPIGDVGMDTYHDGLSNSFSKTMNASVVEDEIEQSFNQSQNSSKPHTPQPTVEEIIENTLRESRSQERTTPQPDMLADIFSSEGRKIPVDKMKNSYSGDEAREITEYQSPSVSQSLHSSARQTPQRDYIGDVYGADRPKSTEGSVNGFDSHRSPVRSTEGSLHGSTRHTPLDDILGQVTSPHGSQVGTSPRGSQVGASPRGSQVGSSHGSARHTPQRTSGHSSARQTPQQLSESFRNSQEKLYGSHGSMPGHGGSRPQSLTSEQELTQYFEQCNKRTNDPSSTGSTKTPTPQQYTTGSSHTGSRPHSTASLPVITTQQRLQAEKRSMTPDNYIRIPGDTSSPSNARPQSSTRTPGSRASNRTITPANDIERQLSVDHVTEKRIEDLEDTVRNLRKLLSAREQEVHELTDQLNDIKDINRSLQDELEHNREKLSGTPKQGSFQELERRYGLLSNEKEILAQEVVTLQDQIDDLQKQVVRNRQPDGETHPRLSSYDPNNPNALQRKIADLQSHVQDLQEANETAVAELHAAERKIKELMKQNEGLQTAQNVNQQDLQAENRRLHDKIARLWEQGYGESDHKVVVENQQLKDDNRAIRERNYKLHEENIKLKEEVTDIRRVLERQATEPKLSRISAGSLERDHYSVERSKLPSVSIDRPAKTSLTVLNGHVDHRPSIEKDGHRYSYRQNKEDKLYTEKDIINSTQKDDSRYVMGVEKSEPSFRGSLWTDDYSYKTSHERELKKSHDIDSKDESRFRSSLERAEAKLRNSLEKNSYLDRISRYDAVSSDKLKTERILDRSYESQTPERPKSEIYRSVPDGISEKDERSPSRRYDTTPERLRSSKLDHMEKRTDYNIESRSLNNMDKEYKTLTASYPELNRVMPATDSDRLREMSRSEVDLRPKRGRSRTPDRHVSCPHRSLSPNQGGLPPQPAFRFRNVTNRRMPHQVYSWDGLKRTEGYVRDQGIMSSYTLPRTRSHYTTQDYYDRDYDNYSYDRKYTSYQSDGNESDTATDILVSAQPYEQKVSPTLSPTESPDHRGYSKYHRRSYSQRRDSLGSDGSSIEDVEESYNRRVHNRSKSADGRELLRRREPMGSSGRSTNRNERLGLTTGDPGFRTVTPNILPTQHNRTVCTGALTNLTSGMRPFAPRTPGDINIEDVVKFSRQGGKLSQGKIKFVGHLPGRSDVYLGVELDKEDGKHDGTFENVRYYKCKPNKGVFVAFNKVVMAWAPNIL